MRMSNWKKDYKVKFHIDFIHYDKRIETVYNEIIVESSSSKLAEKAIINNFKDSYKTLTDIPHGWIGNISNKKLVIDEVKFIWQYNP